jgi:predicted dehydrogenase
MLWLLGNPRVLRVSGKTYQELDMDAKRRAASGYSVEELGLGFVRLDNGVTMDIIEAWAINADSFDGSVVYGRKAGVRIDPFGFFQCIGDLNLNATADLKAYDYRLHNVRGLGDEYDGPQPHWIAALQGRVELLPTAELALNTMLISQGIYLSDRLEREVSAEEVLEMSVSTAVAV